MKSKEFYDKALEPLGMKIVLGSEENGFFGWGFEEPIFEICMADEENPPHKRIHVAFRAKNKEAVDEFYTAAISAGAIDNGKPGPRPKYTETYYAAFVRDFDGNNIEICIH